MNPFRVWKGHPYPLGAIWDGEGTNFAIFGEHGEKVELCIFDSTDPQREIVRRRLVEKTDRVFHGYVQDAVRGTLYGYGVPWRPDAGHRFNPHKLLLDAIFQGHRQRELLPVLRRVRDEIPVRISSPLPSRKGCGKCTAELPPFVRLL